MQRYGGFFAHERGPERCANLICGNVIVCVHECNVTDNANCPYYFTHKYVYISPSVFRAHDSCIKVVAITSCFVCCFCCLFRVRFFSFVSLTVLRFTSDLGLGMVQWKKETTNSNWNWNVRHKIKIKINKSTSSSVPLSLSLSFSLASVLSLNWQFMNWNRFSCSFNCN